MTQRTILIVGHGPSLRDAGLGPEIDQYTVCRMKVFDRFQNKKDHGTRTDYLCCTDSVIKGAAAKCKAEYWVYYKYGAKTPGLKEYPDLRHLTNPWNDWFQKRCHYQGEGPKGRNYSLGTAAGIIALELGFERVIFAGCDTLMNPDLEYESLYNPGTSAKHAHVWPVDNEMLHICAEQKGAELCVLSPHGVQKATRYTGSGFLKHGLNSSISP